MWWALDRRLDFEPPEVDDEFRGRVDDVCQTCWSHYRERQWSAREERTQLAVDVWTERGEEIYFASSVEAQGIYAEEPTLLLVSRDKLETEF